jgi:indole-3-glycerol phosphate synthase/phosphoribosylanthranilate isomerase
VIVAESGIRTRLDVRTLAPVVDAFLIGTAVMEATDPDRVARELIFGPTKVCGLTRRADAAQAARLGATHGGLIFASQSPRRVTPVEATRLVDESALAWVGVFVDEDPAVVARTAVGLGLAAVQLHGQETGAGLRALRQVLPSGVEIWKTIAVADRAPDLESAAFADRVVFDTCSPRARGGTGTPFDWTLVAAADRDGAVLAGGIGPDNLLEAAALGFDFFDVNSAVEEAAGRKSAEALARLFAVRRAAAATPAEGSRQ